MIGVHKAKLLPCPFCGHAATLENFIVEAQVICHGCGAKIVRRHSAKADTGLKDSRRAWNSRGSHK